MFILNRDGTNFTIHFEENFTLTRLLRYRSNSKQLHNQHLALLQLDIEFLANFRFTEEIPCGKDTQVAVFLYYSAILLVYFGILRVTGDIGFVS